MRSHSRKNGAGHWCAAALCVAALAAPRPLPAAGKKVLIVKSTALAPFERAAQEFKKCLGARSVAADFDELALPPDAAQAESALKTAAAAKPDLILTVGVQASRLAREKAPGVPSIFCMALDAAGNKLDKGGVTMEPRPGDYLDYIKRNFPQFKRIGVMYNPEKFKGTGQYQAVREGTHVFVFEPVANLAGLDAALRNLKNKADCLLMVSDPSIYTTQTASQILLQSIQLNLPFIALSAPFVKGGAVAALYADWGDNGCQASELAARALGGENPLSLPLVSPRKLNSSINMVIAGRLGVNVPAVAQASAEDVIR